MTTGTAHRPTKKAKLEEEEAAAEQEHGSPPAAAEAPAAAAAATPALKTEPAAAAATPTTTAATHAATPTMAAAKPAATALLAIDRPLGVELASSGAPKKSGGGGRPATVLEAGRLVFLARPTKVAEEEGMEDLASIRTLYIALSPSEKGEEEGKAGEKEEEQQQQHGGAPPPPADDGWMPAHRLLIIGRKRLPTSPAERYWGFVQAVADSFDGLFDGLLTKPGGGKPSAAGGGALEEPAASAGTRRSKRTKAAKAAGPPPADTRLRVLGEGDYALTRVGRSVRSGHLSYVLAEPGAPGSAQEEVGIGAAGRFVVSVKSPDTRNPAGAGLGGKAKAHFSEAALEAFRGRSGRPLAWQNYSASPDLLNTPHAEFVMIRANDLAASDPGLAESLEAAAEADHAAHAHAHAHGGGGGGGGGKEAEEEEHDRDYTEVMAALGEELHAAALGLDVGPAVTGEF